MTPEDERSLLDALMSDTDVPPEGEFTLEEILAEFGSKSQPVPEEPAEEAEAVPAFAADAPVPESEEPLDDASAGEGPSPEDEPEDGVTVPADGEDACSAEAPDEAAEPQRRVSMEEVVRSTVDAVMEAQDEEYREGVKALLPTRRKRFSRRQQEDTEQLPRQEEPEQPREEEIGPEPELDQVAARYRDGWRKNRARLPMAFLMTLIPALLLAAEYGGLTIPLWSTRPALQSAVLLGCMLVMLLLGRGTAARALRSLRRGRFTVDLAAVLAALTAAADCVCAIAVPDRSAVMPFVTPASAVLLCAMWGGARTLRGTYDTYRTASLDDDPPYLITETEQGACKQKGDVRGFYTTAQRRTIVHIRQERAMPVVLVLTVVLALLSSVGRSRPTDFLLNWSILLCAGATCALPLCWSLPWSDLAYRLQKSGCALAGWSGAREISRQHSIILTDRDLFPPGTISLNGVKVFGEELPRAVSYAATLCRESGCGLVRLFDELLVSEGGTYQPVEDFGFYQQGGFCGTIHGETVLLGTDTFMEKMHVRLPRDITLKTGMFLAVDRQLTAVFAVKYDPSENVDWALRMMRSSRINPILASRDPNITPVLLKRKFTKCGRLEYPDLTTRVALSEAEQDRGLPRALVLREGLLPYADTVVGSQRLCRAVQLANRISLLGSGAGLLLTFYMAFTGAYGLMTPLRLLVFLLLWTLPVLLEAHAASKY